MNEVQHQIDAGGDSGAGVALTVFNIEAVFQNSRAWSNRTKLIAAQVMGGAGMSIKKTGSGRVAATPR